MQEGCSFLLADGCLSLLQRLLFFFATVGVGDISLSLCLSLFVLFYGGWLWLFNSLMAMQVMAWNAVVSWEVINTIAFAYSTTLFSLTSIFLLLFIYLFVCFAVAFSLLKIIKKNLLQIHFYISQFPFTNFVCYIIYRYKCKVL